MKGIEFHIATLNDIEELTAVSIKSFHSDISVGANILKGPPGYNSTDFHREMLREASFFYKIVVSNRIIGGFWFMQKEKKKAYLYRIFLDPDFHNEGIGIESFRFLFKNFPEIKTWSLKTPKWNNRTPSFYQKVGFKISKEDERFLFFERVAE